MSVPDKKNPVLCPVCKTAVLVDHENSNHVYCPSCSYYTNTVFAQFFLEHVPPPKEKEDGKA